MVIQEKLEKHGKTYLPSGSKFYAAGISTGKSQTIVSSYNIGEVGSTTMLSENLGGIASQKWSWITNSYNMGRVIPDTSNWASRYLNYGLIFFGRLDKNGRSDEFTNVTGNEMIDNSYTFKYKNSGTATYNGYTTNVARVYGKAEIGTQEGENESIMLDESTWIMNPTETYTYPNGVVHNTTYVYNNEVAPVIKENVPKNPDKISKEDAGGTIEEDNNIIGVTINIYDNQKINLSKLNISTIENNISIVNKDTDEVISEVKISLVETSSSLENGKQYNLTIKTKEDVSNIAVKFASGIVYDEAGNYNSEYKFNIG